MTDASESRSQPRIAISTSSKAGHRVAGWRTQVSALRPPLLTLAALIAVWEFVVRTRDVPGYLIPAPSEVATALVRDADLLWTNAGPTAIEISLGFALSVLVGVPLGIAFASSSLLNRTVYPLVVVTQMVPKLAFAPLLIVWFGFGLSPKLFLVFLISFFPIVVDTATGMRSAAAEYTELARSLGFSWFETLRKIVLPQAMPSIFSGLKVAMTLAVVGAVVGEFIGAQEGLGYLILVSQAQLKTDLLFAALLSLTIMGMVFYAAVALAERLATPWAREGQDSDS